MTNIRCMAAACAATLLLASSLLAAPAGNRVITWGENTPEWNRILHIGAVRLGCSDAPASCADAAQKLARSQGVDKAFLAILLKPGQTPAYASQYSQLSLNHPMMYEVGFDDFVGQAERQKMPLAAMSAMLVDIARQLKGVNPKLLLGITVYEDELRSSSFPLAELDQQFRGSVDFVHLYPHYRQEAQSFGDSVALARRIFPAAKIIAGVYAYDRRDYLPCAHGSQVPCTNAEELTLFEQSFKERLGMLGNSGVDWLEFYPGSFGGEAQWPLWKQSHICRQDRVQECVENTKAMREVVRKTLSP